ncbi:MAG: transcriptional regulator GcvA [Phenylobacterium sp.]|uniref:transcriptional regulator GcvA n=1 Tax=Phenylobacterium sp. TaxID=1871053 RepID=UPI0011F964CF|nr:transcriptional regulator GcvA [Phenylobacterium sp.]TAJ68640.1 MAG: transcriptional regulator GcvA [Phenylobacterium sp.]
MVRLPPFFALRALEAAARHRSYSGAAKELSVTHGAVSQQIRRLEAELGARLFERRGNAMIPTTDAQRLAGEVSRGLDVLKNAVADFAAVAVRDPLVVSLESQFANRWLPSRLPRMLADLADANLELRVEERRADFTTDGVDIAVRYGAGGWDGVEAAHLFSETLTPVCSPAFLAARPLREPGDLLAVPLLHHGHRPWSLWFGQFGIAPPPQQGMLFEDSAMLLEAAAQGIGVALARSALIEHDLKTGRLVRPFEAGVASELGFWIVWRPDSRKLRRIAALRDWLLGEAAAGGPPHGD